MSTYIKRDEIKEELKSKYEFIRRAYESEGKEWIEIDRLDKAYEETDAAILTIFMSMSYRDYWTHLDNLTDEEENKKFKLHIEYVDGVNERADYYFSQNALRTEELDWLFTDYLIVGSYKKLEADMTEVLLKDLKQSSLFNSIMNFASGKSVVGLFEMVWFLAKWILILGLFGIFLLGTTESPIFGVFALAMVGYFFYKRQGMKKHYTEMMKVWQPKIDLIKKVYSLTSTSKIHWDVLSEEITDSRRNGVEWCTTLFTAIKNRH